MKGTQIYNLFWCVIWLILAIGALSGIIAGNWVHWIFLIAALYFFYISFIDDEDGESLKQYFARKINTTGK